MEILSNESLTNARLDARLDGDIIFTIINCSIFSLSAFFSIILNLLLIISWYFNRIKNNYSDFIFISLAVADFINGLFVCISRLIIQLIKVDKLFEFMLDSVDIAVYIINFLCLILLSYHRLRQLIKPFEEKVTINRIIFSKLHILILVQIICCRN